jgi:hypothetical protein
MTATRWCSACQGYCTPGHAHRPTLFDVPIEDRQAAAVGSATARRRVDPDDSIQARFLAFHEANPRVYELLCRFSRVVVDRGYERVGIKLLWERVRWEVMIETDDPDGFKLSNDFHSRYARLIMEQEPELAGLFRTRELRRD